MAARSVRSMHMKAHEDEKEAGMLDFARKEVPTTKRWLEEMPWGQSGADPRLVTFTVDETALSSSLHNLDCITPTYTTASQYLPTTSLLSPPSISEGPQHAACGAADAGRWTFL